LKADESRLNLPLGAKKIKKRKKRKLKMKMDMLNSIDKQPGESGESVLEKKKAIEERICGKVKMLSLE